MGLNIPFDNSFANLADGFFSRQAPTPVKKPAFVRFNAELARDIGLGDSGLDSPAGAEVLAGNRAAAGSDPLAMVYAGHQFGNWVPQLGDGRAVLLGEVVGPDGIRRDIQLKGAGRTPYSRGGDGRAVLGAVLREYIVSEAMAALGIPTTRALAAVTTGEVVMRERPEPGAVLTRIATSHIRVGTFQYFFARNDTEALRELADYVIARNYPQVLTQDNPYLGLLNAVIDRQADLIARWMGVGFIHGVMNTDNMSIAGETIDYGPCAFMDIFHPQMKFSAIDQQRRYAWGNQPSIAHWNLSQLARCLLHLIDANEDQAVKLVQTSMDGFSGLFSAAYFKVFMAKIGLGPDNEIGRGLLDGLLTMMTDHQIDFTLMFRDLTDFVTTGDDTALHRHFTEPAKINDWVLDWRKAMGADAVDSLAAMQAASPVYIARNHRVAAAINAAENGDYSVFEALVNVLAKPFEDRPENAAFKSPPTKDETVHVTYCGT